MNQYWLQLDGDIIRDVLEFEVEGFLQVELPDKVFPPGINAGWYRWDGAQYNFDQQLYDAAHAGE